MDAKCHHAETADIPQAWRNPLVRAVSLPRGLTTPGAEGSPVGRSVSPSHIIPPLPMLARVPGA